MGCDVLDDISRAVNQYMEIHDQELVIVKADSVEVQDYDGNRRERASYTAELDLSDIGKGTYPYYMLKELHLSTPVRNMDVLNNSVTQPTRLQ
ncbi:glucosamine-fructose-6-phosphate aminotransferase [Streptococcus pneumoniae]|nr:glucosamine-fructose-6-phosphate aminotransferase [Streptococcus pneumoniae]